MLTSQAMFYLAPLVLIEGKKIFGKISRVFLWVGSDKVFGAHVKLIKKLCAIQRGLEVSACFTSTSLLAPFVFVGRGLSRTFPKGPG